MIVCIVLLLYFKNLSMDAVKYEFMQTTRFLLGSRMSALSSFSFCALSPNPSPLLQAIKRLPAHCKCMYVCMYVRMYICMWVYTCMYQNIYIYLMYVYVCLYMHVYVNDLYVLYVCMNVCMYV
jgi:hypothetical protein